MKVIELLNAVLDFGNEVNTQLQWLQPKSHVKFAGNKRLPCLFS